MPLDKVKFLWYNVRSTLVNQDCVLHAILRTELPFTQGFFPTFFIGVCFMHNLTPWERTERALVLIAVIVLLLDLLYWRPL